MDEHKAIITPYCAATSQLNNNAKNFSSWIQTPAVNGSKGFQLLTGTTQYFKESVVIKTPNVKHVEDFQLTTTILIFQCNLFTQITVWKIIQKNANEIFFNCRWAIRILPLQQRSSTVAMETTCHDITALHRRNTAVTTLLYIDTSSLNTAVTSLPHSDTPLAQHRCDVTAVTFSQREMVHSKNSGQ